MNCLFCQKLMRYKYQGKYVLGDPKNKNKLYFCQNCRATLYVDKQYNSWCYFDYYEYNIYYRFNDHRLTMKISKNGEQVSEMILSDNSIAPLTPTNCHKKINTYITFS